VDSRCPTGPHTLLPARNQIDAVVLTHGHEDHIGALAYLCASGLTSRFSGPRLTLACLASKLDPAPRPQPDPAPCDRGEQVEPRLGGGGSTRSTTHPPRAGVDQAPAYRAAHRAIQMDTDPARLPAHRPQRVRPSRRQRASTAAAVPTPMCRFIRPSRCRSGSVATGSQGPRPHQRGPLRLARHRVQHVLAAAGDRPGVTVAGRARWCQYAIARDSGCYGSRRAALVDSRRLTNCRLSRCLLSPGPRASRCHPSAMAIVTPSIRIVPTHHPARVSLLPPRYLVVQVITGWPAAPLSSLRSNRAS